MNNINKKEEFIEESAEEPTFERKSIILSKIFILLFSLFVLFYVIFLFPFALICLSIYLKF